MSNKKNKIELRDMTISLKSEMDLYWDSARSYWEDDWGDYGCDCPSCRPFDHEGDYKYLPEEEEETIIISRRNRIFSHMASWHQGRYRGGMIDMVSIYSKEMLRQKKIDEVLGLSPGLVSRKPTIGDLIQK